MCLDKNSAANVSNVLVSSCLLGIKCRYDGNHSLFDGLSDLLKNFHVTRYCPEVAAGLPTPREPVEIMDDRVIGKSGIDFTLVLVASAIQAVNICKAHNITLAILKEKSPSCGVNYIYDGSFRSQLIAGQGITTKFLRAAGIRVLTAEEFILEIGTGAKIR